MTPSLREKTLYAGKESAVSEVIGSVMLISIVVLAVAIVGVVLWSQPPPEKIPSLSAGIANESCKVSVSHNGGDMLENVTFRILVDGTDKTTNFAKNGNPVWTSWGIGETLTYTSTPCPPMPQNVQIIYTGGNGALSLSSAYFGTQPSGTGEATPTTTVTTTPTPGPAPTVTSITPNTGVNTTTISITNLAGTNFLAGATVKLNRTGYADIAGTSVNVVLPTQITCTFDLTNKAAGQWNVVVTNTDGQSGILINGFAITRPPPTPPWYNCNWGNRKNITIDKSRVSGTLSDFPVLINLPSDAGLASYAQSNGNDILFTSSDGTTKLSHEIETYTSSTGALVAWVKVPSVQSSADTTIYMYYGNSGAANQQNKNGVWGANYKAVWHLKEDPSGAAPQMLDSTSNANHGTSAGTMTTSDQVAAMINGGLDFDGSNDYLGTNYVQTGVTAYTIEAWIKTSTTSVQSVIVHDRGSGAGQSLTLEVGGTYPGGPGAAGNVGYGVDSNGIFVGRYSTSTVNDNNWHHVVGVWTAPSGTAIAPAQFSVYIDGNAAATNNAATGSATSPLTGLGGTQLAYHQPWGRYLPGIIDEVRISTSSLSADWIKTEYNNQNSPSTFYYLGNQEQWTC
ncbi:MAG: DUF2341 domain-containing protein [Methanoregula sp.]|nr:DUF2341 domain-containing protein [Methanoregula sp.]